MKLLKASYYNDIFFSTALTEEQQKLVLNVLDTISDRIVDQSKLGNNKVSISFQSIIGKDIESYDKIESCIISTLIQMEYHIRPHPLYCNTHNIYW